MPGRIETYVHSDNVTQNKAAAMVRLSCQTDFAANTPHFVAFCKDVAKYACAFQTQDPAALFAIAAEADLPGKLEALQDTIGETVRVDQIVLMKLDPIETATEKRQAKPGKYAELARLRKSGTSIEVELTTDNMGTDR